MYNGKLRFVVCKIVSRTAAATVDVIFFILIFALFGRVMAKWRHNRQLHRQVQTSTHAIVKIHSTASFPLVQFYTYILHIHMDLYMRDVHTASTDSNVPALLCLHISRTVWKYMTMIDVCILIMIITTYCTYRVGTYCVANGTSKHFVSTTTTKNICKTQNGGAQRDWWRAHRERGDFYYH